MALREVEAWLDGDLVLPIGGKKYRVPEPSAELGMRLEAIADAGLAAASQILAEQSGGQVEGREVSARHRQILDDDAERDLYRDLLGAVYDDMVRDGVTWPRLKHAATTAILHFAVSPEAAEAHWDSAVPAGKAPAGQGSRPATRRTTAAASSTKPRASGSGTRSRPRS